jgi:hypothetical protein
MISTTERRPGEPTRENARVPCTIPVELTLDEQKPGFEADAVDLSAGGLSLRAASLPEVGATLHCRFDSLPGGTRISGRGEVVWRQPAGERSGEFGLRFTEIDPRAQALISEMIAERVATGGIGSPHQPRMATLEFEENEGPITAKLTRAVGRDVVFEQPLDVLALGRGVVAYADKTLGHGNILRVDLRMDNGTPTLALTVRFSEEQERFGEFGEFDWGDPEQRARSADADTVPDLAAPLAAGLDLADAADSGRSSRVATSAGGTLAPAQGAPAEHLPTRAGGFLAPAAHLSDAHDPLSPDATSAALARIAEQEQRQRQPAVGTPLAAALAASNARRSAARDTEPTGARRDSEIRTTQQGESSPGSDSAPGSIRAQAAQYEASSAGFDSTPGSVLAEDGESEEQLTAAADDVLAEGPASAGSESRSYAPWSRASMLDTVPHTARRTRPLPVAAVSDRDTDLSAEPEPEPRHTPPLDPRHTPIPEPIPGLAGSRVKAKGTKQMDLTFAGEEEEDFTDADEYEVHAGEEPDFDAIAVLDSETLSDPDDVRHTEPFRPGLARDDDHLNEPALSRSYSGTAAAWGPTETARKSPLVRFLRVFAALIDRIQMALGLGTRALKRASDSVLPVVRRHLARRGTLRGVGSRRRSAGAPAAAAATPLWKLPKGSGRLVLLAILMVGCGVLLVYAFPQSDGDQIDVHRQVRADGEDPEAAQATETTTNAATAEQAAPAAAGGTQLSTTKQQLTAASTAKSTAKSAGGRSDASASSATFGSKQVPNPQRFVLRTSNPITSLQGKSDAGGFTVILPNTRALDKAGPIARANAAVAKAQIINRNGYAELNVRFAQGRNPAYRVSAQQAGLEVLIGR